MLYDVNPPEYPRSTVFDVDWRHSKGRRELILAGATMRAVVQRLLMQLFSGLAIASADCTIGLSQQLPFDAATVVEEISNAVREEFFDASLGGVDWVSITADSLVSAKQVQSRSDFADIINRMLGELNSSHTSYYSLNDPQRYQLIGVFEHLATMEQTELLEYECIGIDTWRQQDRTFIKSVYDGFPAARAGLHCGDELVAVDGLPFCGLDSFRGKAGGVVQVTVRQRPDDPTHDVSVEVERLNGRTMFEKSLASSAAILKQADQTIGYVHLWSYAGEKYHEQLTELILYGKLSQCDALILDLRDGWGGANVGYLNLFRKPILDLKSTMRDGATTQYTGVWGKPVVLLVNRGTTSGKELFVAGFKKLGLGEVVGETTAGAVLGGKASILSNGDVLYLAVADVHVDGQRMEGVGVEPTIEVSSTRCYTNGADPQLESAIKLLAPSE